MKLTTTDIDAEIIKLSWPTNNFRRLPNIESEARRLRFQALGSACHRHGIQSLLLAHHADDQAETVLFRISKGYTGSGLRGIKPRAEVPECYGIWGVGRSGSLRFVDTLSNSGTLDSERQSSIEDGGVEIHRPLLGSSKHDIRAHCLKHQVEWAEDPTNSDPSLTPRNAIRSLLSSQRLPRAVSTKSLQKIAHNTALRETSHEQAARQVFEASDIQLDIRSGSVKVKLPVDTVKQLQDGLDEEDCMQNLQYRAAVLVRRLAMLVSPLESIALRDVESAVRLSFPSFFADPASVYVSAIPQASTANFAKVVFRLASDNGNAQHSHNTGQIEWLIRRTKPTSQEQGTLRLNLPANGLTETLTESHAWSSWALFDGRFWIRVQRKIAEQSNPAKIFVRFLRPEDLSAMNQNKSDATSYKRLKQLLRGCVPGEARFTLPAIIESHEVVNKQQRTESVDRLVALPSISWTNSEWKQWSGVEGLDGESHNHWDIRYKKIDLWSRNDGKHCFIR